MDNKWIPEWATHFSMLKSNYGLLTIKFHEGSPAFNIPEDAVFSGIDELPGMLSRADVCQQIAGKSLADRMAEFDYQWVGHCTAHVHHNRAFIGIVQKRMIDDVWFATSPHVGIPCETADQAARLLLAVHEVST